MSNDLAIFYGKVLWFSSMKGFGFAEWEIDGVKQKDIFIHFSDINCEGFKTLYKHQNIKFSIGTNKHGDPKAINVEILKN